MARNKIDPAVSRKAYAEATKALKERYAADFADLLDEAYAAQGVESPNARRQRLEKERILKSEAAQAQREAREQKKIDDALALLESKGIRMNFDVPTEAQAMEAEFSSDIEFEVVAEGSKAS